MEIIYNLGDIETAVKEFIPFTSEFKVFAFSGELGAGKTTFINELCRQLQVNEIVTSPTYAIIHEYYSGIKGTVYHLDLYRIRNIEEAIDAGVEDCLLSDKLCLVEWPEKAMGLFSPGTVYISLQVVSAGSRKLIVKLP